MNDRAFLLAGIFHESITDERELRVEFGRVFLGKSRKGRPCGGSRVKAVIAAIDGELHFVQMPALGSHNLHRLGDLFVPLGDDRKGAQDRAAPTLHLNALVDGLFLGNSDFLSHVRQGNVGFALLEQVDEIQNLIGGSVWTDQRGEICKGGDGHSSNFP